MHRMPSTHLLIVSRSITIRPSRSSMAVRNVNAMSAMQKDKIGKASFVRADQDHQLLGSEQHGSD